MSFISYAQNFEDVILNRALKDIKNGFYIDVGANDPVADSVTKAFYDDGWRGINIEPVSEWFKKLEPDRSEDINLQVAAGSSKGNASFYEVLGTGLSTMDKSIAENHASTHGFEIKEYDVPVVTLTSVCEQHAPSEIHFLKIDVETSELAVLQGLNLKKFRPWIVLVEATQPLSQIEDYKAWENILLTADYGYCYFDGLNRFYVANEHHDLKKSLSMPPNVFDGFILSGFGSSSEHTHLGNLKKSLFDNDAQRQSLQASLNQAEQQHHALTTQLHTLQQEAADRESLLRQKESKEQELMLSLLEKETKQQESNVVIQDFKQQVVHLEGTLADNDAQRQSLQASLKQAEQQHNALTTQLQSLQQEAADRESLLRQKESKEQDLLLSLIEEETKQRTLTNELKDSIHKIGELNQSSHHWWLEAERLSKELQSVYDSRSWLITWPLRKFSQFLRWLFHLPCRAVRWFFRLFKRMIRWSLVRTMTFVLNRPMLKIAATERLKKHPRIHNKLRLLATSQGLSLGGIPQSDQVQVNKEKAQTFQPKEASVEQHENELQLTQDRGIDEPAWATYLDSICKKQLVDPLGDTDADSTLWICISEGENHAVGKSLLKEMENSLLKLKRKSKHSIRVEFLVNSASESLNDLSDMKEWLHVSNMKRLAVEVAPDDLLVFVGVGDEISLEFDVALSQYSCFEAEFSIIDLFYRENNRIFPLLFHGVDTLHGVHCDYFYSRFCMRGDVLSKLMQKELHETTRDLAVAYLSSIQMCRGIGSLAHITLPLIGANISRADIVKMRKLLIQGQYKDHSFIGKSKGSVGDSIDSWKKASVSVVICTKDNAQLLQVLVRMLKHNSNVHEIIIVSNNTTNEYALNLLDSMVDCGNIKIIQYNNPFNFSAQCNLGVKNASGEFILFLNDDISPITDDWLDVMLRYVRKNPRCIVGPLLLYPDQTVQHGGMFLGFNGVAGHFLRHSRIPDDDYNFMLAAPRQVSCLTGAVMLMSRQFFDDLNGFDPLLATGLQDVDLSLRAMHSGGDLIFEPRSVLFHMESITLKGALADARIARCRENEYQYFIKRWENEINNDKWLNPLFSLSDDSLRTLKL